MQGEALSVLRHPELCPMVSKRPPFRCQQVARHFREEGFSPKMPRNGERAGNGGKPYNSVPLGTRI